MPFEKEETVRQRDSQRSKVYAAETATHGWRTPKTAKTIEECSAYAHKVLADAVVRRHYPLAKSMSTSLVVVGGRRRGGSYMPTYFDWSTGYTSKPTISLGVAARSEWVILHEIAHAIVGHDHAWHGPEWVECYLFLVRRFLGVELHDLLKANLVERGVRVKPKAKRAPLSPERKAELSQRLAAARAAKAAAS